MFLLLVMQQHKKNKSGLCLSEHESFFQLGNPEAFSGSYRTQLSCCLLYVLDIYIHIKISTNILFSCVVYFPECFQQCSSPENAIIVFMIIRLI